MAFGCSPGIGIPLALCLQASGRVVPDHEGTLLFHSGAGHSSLAIAQHRASVPEAHGKRGGKKERKKQHCRGPEAGHGKRENPEYVKKNVSLRR